MLSRIFWVLLAGVALVAGAATQGNLLFGWGDDREKEAAIEARVERSVEGRVSKMEVADSDGRTIHVRPETKRELGHAIKRLVSAEAEVALARVTDESDAAIQATRARRDAARADVVRLKAQIHREEQLSKAGRDALRTKIRENVRQSVREAIPG